MKKIYNQEEEATKKMKEEKLKQRKHEKINEIQRRYMCQITRKRQEKNIKPWRMWTFHRRSDERPDDRRKFMKIGSNQNLTEICNFEAQCTKGYKIEELSKVHPPPAAL